MNRYKLLYWALYIPVRLAIFAGAGVVLALVWLDCLAIGEAVAKVLAP